MAVGGVDVAVHLRALAARVELRNLLREREDETEREGREADQRKRQEQEEDAQLADPAALGDAPLGRAFAAKQAAESTTA